ncbi:MAG TPA: hypothetical protein VG713_19195, partial [Pirellulales bacterium]|nr:hypothetical protein [Pirellulales bacterium]
MERTISLPAMYGHDYPPQIRRDVAFAITIRLRARLSAVLRTASSRRNTRTLALVGCTGAELKAYLESKFLPGMTWENRSEWHIDHIRPVASFDLTDPD